MAEQRRSGRGKGVPHHPLVEALASDPEKPPEKATKLFGFPGPAAAAKSTRLWLDTDLTSYVEVPDEAIVHSQTLENDRGTILWVEPAATLTYSSTQSQEVQAEFLGGSITAGNLGGAMLTPGVSLGVTLDKPTCEPGCGPVPSHDWAPCQETHWPLCMKVASFICTTPPRCAPLTSQGCVSRLVICRSRACPSLIDGCASEICVETGECFDPIGPFRPIR
jgi:hypothetical protein